MILTITANTAIDRTVEVANFRVDDVMQGRVVASVPAGKGVNISRTLATLDKPSIISGFVGGSDLALYEQEFADSQAQLELVPVAEPTRFDTTIIDPFRNTVTHIREQGFHVSSDDLARLSAKLEELLPSASIVVLAGSLPPGMDEKALAALMQQCQGSGRRVCVDTSGHPLAAALEQGCFLIKPNARELSEIAGRPINTAAEAAAQARELVGQAQIVLTTLGDEGAVCVTEEGAWLGRVYVPADQVLNTVGCGDAFVAGFLTGLLRDKSMASCLRRAIACGAASALTPSAGAIEPPAVARLAKKVEIEEIDA